jgi:hypothetical protein
LIALGSLTRTPGADRPVDQPARGRRAHVEALGDQADADLAVGQGRALDHRLDDQQRRELDGRGAVGHGIGRRPEPPQGDQRPVESVAIEVRHVCIVHI